MLPQTARRRPPPRRPDANTGATASAAARAAPPPSPDRFRIKLGKEAVKLALNGNWPRAAAVNRAILELHPQDSEAANRLAKALMELGDYAGARTVLDDLCRRDPRNAIARKNRARLENLATSAGAGVKTNADAGAPTLPPATPPSAGVAGAPALFIQDGGKSGTAILRPVAPAPVPFSDDYAPPAALAAAVSPGDPATLSIVNADANANAGAGEAVLVKAADGSILGALEPRMARRLRRLIAGGNRYSAAVVGIAGARISVIIRETHCDPALRNVVSFPAAARAPAIHSDAYGDDDGDTDTAVAAGIRPETPAGSPPENASEPDADSADADPETIAAALVSDHLDDDDADAAADTDDDAVPMLDDDAAADHALPAFIAPVADDWE